MNWLKRIAVRMLLGNPNFAIDREMGMVTLEKGKPVKISEFSPSPFVEETTICLVDLKSIIVQYGTRGTFLASATNDATIKIMRDGQPDRQGILKHDFPHLESSPFLLGSSARKLRKVLRHPASLYSFPSHVAVSIGNYPSGDIFLSLKEVLDDEPGEEKVTLNLGCRIKMEPPKLSCNHI